MKASSFFTPALKEPLVHFLALGTLIFGVHGWRQAGREPANPAPAVEVTAGVVERLCAGHERQFRQKPDAETLKGLVADHLREEILSREALALGLDRDDSIVRRRLAQKMEFLTTDLLVGADPDEAALQAFLDRNAARYARPGRVTFRHVYFSRERRGNGLEAAAAEGMAVLGAGRSDEALGDAFLHGHEFDGREVEEIATLFGPDFAGTLADAPVGRWVGPIASSYGVHLVRVDRREATRPATVAEVRPALLRDWRQERRETGNRELYERLKKRYRITVDEAALVRATSAGQGTQASR